MNRERLLWISLLFLLLLISLALGRHFVSPPSVEGASFRQGFWERRGLDLVAQIGLIDVGALGLAALLPMKDEDE